MNDRKKEGDRDRERERKAKTESKTRDKETICLKGQSNEEFNNSEETAHMRVVHLH